jgi:hypothetical protein
LLFAASGPSVDARDRIEMRASPEVSLAPARLVVRTTIEADAANRAVEVVIESLEYYRSSVLELDGANAPRTSIFEFRGVPGGDYQISASLLDAEWHPIANVRRVVNVIRQGSEAIPSP